MDMQRSRQTQRHLPARPAVHEPARTAPDRFAQDLRRPDQGRAAQSARGRASSSPTTGTTPSATTCGSSTGTSTPGSTSSSSNCSSRRKTSTSRCWSIAARAWTGQPEQVLYGRRVAAAMAYIGLVNYDRVNLYGLTISVAVRRRACAAGARSPDPGLPADLEPWAAATWARHAGGSQSSTGQGCGDSHQRLLRQGRLRGGLRYLLAGTTSTPCRSFRRGRSSRNWQAT